MGEIINIINVFDMKVEESNHRYVTKLTESLQIAYSQFIVQQLKDNKERKKLKGFKTLMSLSKFYYEIINITVKKREKLLKYIQNKNFKMKETFNKQKKNK